ncbi:nuclear transport factor 2 family protein [Flavobacterium qiangtangense]|uniref:Nuclear transport factor 2 family protein n=1 Tax=Flavobacterium qiangtangense TaxID=1442595 RepID=A0ABW1PI51_9FLAO
MNSNEQIIEEFYAAFAEGNAETMASCYHPDIVFEDPAFGKLEGKDASDMWHMLIERAKGNLEISFSDIQANDRSGTAKWVAKYHFSKTNRNVVNKIKAYFEFKDGLIIKHTDNFDFYNWSKQALGTTGLLLGWTSFLRKKVQKQALESLRKYQQKNP